MRRRAPLYPSEQNDRLARTFGLSKPDNGQEALETAFRARHPTRAATREQAALRAAGCYIAFERLGMVATFAVIRGSAFGRHGWDGHADAVYRIARKPGPGGKPPATFRGEAIAALCGPVAEELWHDVCSLSSVGLLAAGASYARRAAELEGRDQDAVAREVVASAIGLVERHEGAIWDAADMLDNKKRIHRRDPAVRDLFASMPRGPLVPAPLSEEGQPLCDKITGALAELRSLGLPTFGEAGLWTA